MLLRFPVLSSTTFLWTFHVTFHVVNFLLPVCLHSFKLRALSLAVTNGQTHTCPQMHMSTHTHTRPTHTPRALHSFICNSLVVLAIDTVSHLGMSLPSHVSSKEGNLCLIHYSVFPALTHPLSVSRTVHTQQTLDTSLFNG